MKNFCQYSLLALLCLLVAAMSSCSSKPDLLKYASDEDAVIITGSLSDVLENAGCEVAGAKIQLSPEVKKMCRTQEEKVDFGVDPDHCLFTVNYASNYMLFAVPLTSESTFEKSLSNDQDIYRTRTERDGMTLYSVRDHLHLVVSDGTLLLVGSLRSNKIAPDAVVNQALDLASKSPLASWQTSILDGDNTLNVLFNVKQFSEISSQDLPFTIGFDPEAVRTGYVSVTAELKNQTIKSVAQVYNSAGEILANSLLTEKPDTDMLRYASDGAVAAVMAAVPQDVNWQKILTDAFSTPAMRSAGLYADNSTIDFLSEVLGKVSGTMLLTVEPGALMDLNKPTGWGLSFAVQMKPGAAKEYVEDLQKLFTGENLVCTPVTGGFEGTIPDVGTVRVVADDNVFFLTNMKASTPRGNNKNITAADFSGVTGGVVIKMPKGSPLLSVINLYAGLDMSYTATPDKITFETTLTDAKGSLLENLLRLLPY